jgi:hypothetical protein
MAQWQRAGLIKMCLLKYITPRQKRQLTAVAEKMAGTGLQFRLIFDCQNKSTLANKSRQEFLYTK